jgi:hypothetical protein
MPGSPVAASERRDWGAAVIAAIRGLRPCSARPSSVPGGAGSGCGRGRARVGCRSRYSYAMAATQRLGARLEGAIPEPPEPRTVDATATISRGKAEALRNRP